LDGVGVYEAAILELKKILKPGDTVRTILRHVSASGMTRRIDAYAVQDGETRFLSGYIAKAVGYRLDRKGGLVVSGCDMDIGFDIVYQLGCTLWPSDDGKYSKQRNGDKGPETDGGYLLRQEWL